MEVLSKEELEQVASDFCTTHPSCPNVVLQEYEESQHYTTESSGEDQLLIEVDLPEETGHDQDEWMAALASHAATDVYESADDYDVVDGSLNAICQAHLCPQVRCQPKDGVLADYSFHREASSLIGRLTFGSCTVALGYNGGNRLPVGLHLYIDVVPYHIFFPST